MLGSVQTVHLEGNTLMVVNCFTQVNYGREGKRYADLRAVEETLRKAVLISIDYDLPFYMPAIGCGLGGLDWDTEVKPIVDGLVEALGADITLCVLKEDSDEDL